MKRKHLSPYINNCRYSINDPQFFGVWLCVGNVFLDGMWYNTFGGYLCSKQEAMDDLDNQLIKHSYILLTQEQYDKLVILL